MRYDPEIISRSLNRLGRTITDANRQENRHDIGMAHLGLSRARQDAAINRRGRELDAQLAEAEYEKNLDEQIPLSTYIAERGGNLKKYSRALSDAGINIDEIMTTRRKGADIQNALSAEARGVQRGRAQYRQERADKKADNAGRDLYYRAAAAAKWAEAMKKTSGFSDDDKKTYLTRKIAEHGIVFDPKRGYGRVEDDGVGGTVWVPMPDEGARWYNYYTNRLNLVQKVMRESNVNAGTADILIDKMQQKQKAREEYSKKVFDKTSSAGAGLRRATAPTIQEAGPVVDKAVAVSPDMWENFNTNRGNAFRGAGIPDVLMQEPPKREYTGMRKARPYNARF